MYAFSTRSPTDGKHKRLEPDIRLTKQEQRVKFLGDSSVFAVPSAEGTHHHPPKTALNNHRDNDRAISSHRGDGSLCIRCSHGRRCSAASPIVLGPSMRSQQCVQGRPFVHCCAKLGPMPSKGVTPDVRNHVCASRHGNDGPFHHVGGAFVHVPRKLFAE
ncbi:hypothetical protein TcasGA2_TC032482 [Tribolium castaneum]|uniref:Uncharacterized protein n=1 Tax=Tribolium castaneum TaxID=7070 RepID=A0A139WL80_TRICA|nr:hypothetical protein TcasGA2_TC032482 [Tribolium castaneum]